MPASATYSNSYLYSSQMVGVPECVADQIDVLAPWETMLLSLVGLNSLPTPCTDVTYKWQEFDHLPTQSTLSTAVTTSDTTFVMTSAVFKASELVVSDYEVIQLGTTSDNLTFAGCSRSKGAGATASHAANAKVVGLNTLSAQGAASGTAIANLMPVQRTNYTTILNEDIMASLTAMALPRYGRAGNEFDYQAGLKLKKVFHEIENRAIWGYSQAASTGSTAGSMKGIYETLASNASSLSSANPTWENFESYVESINNYDDTASDLYLYAPLYTCRVINSWGLGKIQHDIEVDALPRMVLGASVSAMMLGDRRVVVVPFRKFSSTAMIINPAKIGVGPLVGRELSLTLMGRDGSRVKGLLDGEYTCAVMQPKAHKFLYALKTS